MNMKVLIVVLIISITIAYCDGKAALRRKPKVYNALITTDEDLEQSRAYPVIQPTIHESGIAHYPYGPYGPYGLYSPHVVRLAQPIVPALTSKGQLPYPLPPAQISPQLIRQPFAGYPLPQNLATDPPAENSQRTSLPPTALEEQSQPTAQQGTAPDLPQDPNQPSKMPSEKLPMPINQYGLPPSPLKHPQPYQPYLTPTDLQAFYLPPYRLHPLRPLHYNSLPGLRQHFLPPYDYLPTGPQFPLSNTIPTDKNYPLPPSQPLPMSTTATPTPSSSPPVTTAEEFTESTIPTSDPKMAEPTFESIKNGSKNQDSNVPDVPPPPIPSGAKSKQS